MFEMYWHHPRPGDRALFCQLDNVGLSAGEPHVVSRPGGTSSYNLHVIMDGSGWVRLDGDVITPEPGSFFIIPPGTPERYGATPPAYWSVRWIHFTGSLIQTWLRTLGLDQTRLVRVLDTAPFASAHAELCAVMRKRSESDAATVSALVYRCLAELFSRVVPEGSTLQPRHNQQIQQALDHLHVHYADPLTLSDLADRAGLSLYHFNRLFTRIMGEPPMRYLASRRLAFAKALLTSRPNLPVFEVARQIGYTDASHFGKVFRAATGLSPRRFRQMYSSRA